MLVFTGYVIYLYGQRFGTNAKSRHGSLALFTFSLCLSLAAVAPHDMTDICAADRPIRR